jgi:hypothetical protein
MVEAINETNLIPQQPPSAEESADGPGKAARNKWGFALDSGFQVVPNVLFRCQRILRLKPLDVVILMNITTHWWSNDDLPHPRPSVIANRMDVSTRTVERRLLKMQKMGLIRRLESRQKNGRAVRQFELTGLVEKLKAVSVENLKMRRVAQSEAMTVPEDD